MLAFLVVKVFANFLHVIGCATSTLIY